MPLICVVVFVLNKQANKKDCEVVVLLLLCFVCSVFVLCCCFCPKQTSKQERLWVFCLFVCLFVCLGGEFLFVFVFVYCFCFVPCFVLCYQRVGRDQRYCRCLIFLSVWHCSRLVQTSPLVWGLTHCFFDFCHYLSCQRGRPSLSSGYPFQLEILVNRITGPDSPPHVQRQYRRGDGRSHVERNKCSYHCDHCASANSVRGEKTHTT